MPKTLSNIWKTTFISGAICLGIFIALFWAQDISPFGDRTLLTIDAYHQYAPFHAELREKLSSGGSPFYSWTNGLGKDFYAQATYYTYSPLSLLVLLFPAEGIIAALQLMIVLKTLLAVMAAAFVLTRLSEYEAQPLAPPLVSALALTYAFSGFFAAFYWNVMWLDAMALLPLVLLGLHELASGKGKWRFLLSFAACLITNYFMGVIIMFCSLPLYAALLVGGHSRSQWLCALRRFGRFMLCLLVAIGLAMIVLLPSLRSLGSTDAVGLGVDKPLHFFSRLPDVIAQHLMGAQPQVGVIDNPFANAYSGVMTLLLVPLYFSLEKVPRKHKIVTLLLVVFFYLCMNNAIFDYIIHGFHINKALPHRFAFVYTLLLILIARRVLLHWRELQIKWLAVSIGAIALLAIYSVVINPVDDQRAKLSAALLIVNLLMLAGYGGALILGQRLRIIGQALPILLLCAVCIELFYSQYSAISFCQTNDAKNYSQGRDALADARAYEDGEGFYRTEIYPPTTTNDAALYDYRGMATFSSIINLNTAALLRNLGYPGTAVSYNFADNTPFTTSLLNIRYLYDRNERGEPYKALYSHGNMTFYENSTALPPGFVSDAALLNFDGSTPDGPFMLQNTLADALTGGGETLLCNAPVTAYGGENLILSDKGNGSFYYELTDPKALDVQPTANFALTAAQDGPVWLAIDTTHSQLAEISTQDYTTYIEMGKANTIVGLGNLRAGDTVTIRMDLTFRYVNQRYYYPDGELRVHAATLDMAAFDVVQETLAARPFVIDSFGDNELSGTVDAGDGGILFLSIPYGNGWSATVDGEAVETMAVADESFFGVVLSPGRHDVSLQYETPGFYRGALYSVGSLAILIAWIVLTQRGKMKHEEEKNV